MKKKICFISPHTHPPWIEGIRNNVYGVSKELVKNNEVHIITSEPSGKLKDTKIDGIHIKFLKGFSLKPYRIICNSIKHYKEIKNYLEENKIEIIHFQTVDLTLLIPSAILLMKFKAKKFITLFNFENINQPIKKIFFSLFYKKYDKIIVIAPCIKKHMKKKYVKNTVIIPATFDKKKFKIKVKKSLEAKIKKRTIIYTAGSKTEEGIYLFLEALKSMKDVKGIIALYTISEHNKERRRKIIEFIKQEKISNVEIYGSVEKMEDLMASESAFIMPLQTDMIKMNVPLSMLEAMACGTPVIASNIDSNKDIINHDVNGILFKNKNHQDMMAKIRYLFNDTKNYDRIRKNAIKYIMNWQSYKEIAKKLEELYETKK